ncbi:MAG: hypothetical protein JO210_10975 [Acidobacteriaceae bacterium]|nr:hypothetical protein [Acidobacteriaceae bacterium]
MKTRQLALLVALRLANAFSSNPLQEHHHAEEQAPERLGTVSFSISCSPGVQAKFARGVALLHSFGYAAAEKVFEQIESDEPSCAMAYWGDAMTRYHQLWDRPSPADLAKGWALVQRAEAQGPKTDREREYIAAAAAFYSHDPNLSFKGRSDAYVQAMEKLHRQFPDDHEAAIFYALALVGSPHANENDFVDRKKAVSILNAVLKDEPDHPGVAHYLIHACDNPEMAKEGLAAARRYAQIAPDSPHALHMPSHIFARLGLWQDDIASNLESKAAAEKQSSTHDRIHAMDFLEYAYLQTGQSAKAKTIEEEALETPKEQYSENFIPYFLRTQVHFPSLFTLETRAWTAAEALRPPAHTEADFQAIIYWTQAIAAGHLHNVASARVAVQNYDSALDAVKKSAYAYVADGMTTTRDEAHAWLAFAEGDSTECTRLLRKVADEQDKIGKGEVELPAREMLADMLLEFHRPTEALAEYKRSLQTDPNRFNALYGAARAAEDAGKPESARLYYKQLLANCPEGDRAELAHAKTYLKGFDADDSNH